MRQPKTLIAYTSIFRNEYTVRRVVVCGDGSTKTFERVVNENTLRAIGDHSINETIENAQFNYGKFVPVSNPRFTGVGL